MELGRLGRLFADLYRTGDGDGADARDRESVATRACAACVELLEVGGAGILLVDDDGRAGAFGASGAAWAGVVEELQFVLGEGPGVDAHARGQSVLEPDLARVTHTRWTAFTPAALQAGVQRVFSVPLRVGAIRVGALDLSDGVPGPLGRQQRIDAVVMADVVTRRLLATQADAPPGRLGSELDDDVHALRVEVHQAAGMLSEQLDIRSPDALVLLRAAAYASERPIDEIAHEVVARTLRFDDGQV
jgi:hypothetical protein